MLVLGFLSFLYIVSSQEMMLPVGGWSAPPPLPIKITSTGVPRDHPPNDISSWQLRCIASFLYLHILLSALKICEKKYRIVLSMYTAFMLSIVRNLEMLLYMREELVLTNSIRTWPATGFCIYRSPDFYPRAHSETAIPQCPSGDTFLISSAGGALGAAWLPHFLKYCQAYFPCSLHFNSMTENLIPGKENYKLFHKRTI